MSQTILSYEPQSHQILEAARVKIKTTKPSEWTEANVVMGKPKPGPFRYVYTPYTREIIDCFAPDHPARTVAVMKGAQVGFSSGVLYPAVGWIMDVNPGNTLFMVGHEDLVDETMNKIDIMIDNAGLRKLIRPAVNRRKAGKTGDTSKQKEFPGGYLVLGSANNHKILRQRDMQYGIIDDYEAVKKASKESGSTQKLFEQRFAAYADKMKLFFISTPELKQNSNIEPAYLAGDQRRYFIPCPHCGDLIPLEWSVEIEGNEQEKGGIYWKTDAKGRLISDSVGYVCQKCGGWFNDRNKHELLLAGEWRPTAEASRLGYYSYHLSSLYAPPGMYDWEHYVQNWIEAHPENGKRDESLYKSFVNLCLGQTYENDVEAIKANKLQENICKYEVGTVPEKLSQNIHNNGQIVMLTCAADLNGRVEDARLDYEVVAWAENGACYSIEHGSIGTFIPRESTRKHKVDRERWTYDLHAPNSVWKPFNEVLGKVWEFDTGKSMRIMISGIDTGHYTNYAYEFIDNSNFTVVGLKGETVKKYTKFGIDVPLFKPGRERSNLYILESNKLKDLHAEYIALKYNEDIDDSQPYGFKNFPMPEKELYQYKTFFSHYEAEVRKLHEDGSGFVWDKKQSNSQNHFLDVSLYNYAIRDIFTKMACQSMKIKNYTWKDCVDVLLSRV